VTTTRLSRKEGVHLGALFFGEPDMGGDLEVECTTQAEIQPVGEEGTSAFRPAVSGDLNFPNRRIRTRTYGGVGGE